MIEHTVSANVSGYNHVAPKFKELSSAQITWVQDEDDNNWVVRNDDGDELFQLPGRLTDKEAMGILRAAREFELKAYKQGKETGEGAIRAAMKNTIVEMDMRIMVLENENKRLAEILDNTIGGD